MSGGVQQGDEAGRCWGCGYLLRGLPGEVRQCPECGRGFDPLDRGTMNFGRETGRVGRWMVRPVSWWVVVMGVIGAVMVVSVSRWPVGGAWPWFVDLGYYFRLADWRERVREVGWEGVVYMAGVLTWAVVLVGWWVGAALRWVAIWRYRPAKFQRGSDRWRQWVLCLGLVVVVLGVGVGWSYRLGRLWAFSRQSDEYFNGAYFSTRLGTKTAVLDSMLSSEEETVGMLRSAARYGRTPKERLYAVRAMVESWEYGPYCVAWLVEAEASERDVGNRALLLRLIGMYRKGEVGEVLERRLEDALPEIRAAAADGLGCLHGLAYHKRTGWTSATATKSDPPIDVRQLRREESWTWGDVGWKDPSNEGRIAMGESRREKLMGMMLGDSTLEEREAAARAMLAWPAEGYKLRVAEWGVWVNKGAYIQGAREKGAIPWFVHEAGDSMLSLSKRLHPPIDVDKPVIHLTASSAMAVDLEVRIHGGRPWYVYPMPDDYAVTTQFRGFSGGRSKGSGMLLDRLDSREIGVLSGKALRQGYPWLMPAHPVVAGDHISEVGVRWQSLIVSPSKLSWMKEEAVDGAGAAGWWARLREVESSWVSSRGESERFLYYDGPTLMQAPVTFSASKDGGTISAQMKDGPGEGDLYFASGPWREGDDPLAWREALVVQVKGGLAKIWRLGVPVKSIRGPAGWPRVLDQEAVEGSAVEAFEGIVRGRGLSESEAKGMAESWRREFFETEGARVLLFLDRHDYDAFCPIRVRPKPTEVVRVGVFWVEF